MHGDGIESDTPADGEDIVDVAVRSLREFGARENPDALLLAQTRQALEEVAQGNRVHFGFRRLSAAAGILLALTAASFVLKYHADRRMVVMKPAITKHPEQAPANALTHVAMVPAPIGHNRPAPEPAAQTTELAAAIPDGIVTGRVLFDGPRLAPAPIPAANAMPHCVAAHGGPICDESMIVNRNGTLANVVVSVSEGLSGWLPEEFPPAAPAVLNQRGCVFEPHVVPVMVGQQLLIKNSDPFLHNVRIMAVNNPPANLGQPSLAESQTAPFRAPEVFRVRCDVHPWMGAWVRVMDNPFFAVTGSDGQFTLHGLPPGVYTLKAWHEQLGVREMEVTVEPGHGAAVDFTFHAGTVRFPSHEWN